MSNQNKFLSHNRFWIFIPLGLVALGVFVLLNSTQSSDTKPSPSAEAATLIDKIEAVSIPPQEISSELTTEAIRPTDSTRQIIVHVEKNLILPTEAEKIEDYTRYYSVRETSEKKELIAVYVLNGGWTQHYSELHKLENTVKPHTNVFFIQPGQLPRIRDGGCSVINLSYELTDKPLPKKEKITVMSLNSRHPPQTGTKVIGYCNGVA